MGDARLVRSETTRGSPLRILSLDGGGVRGYSMLILLHDFMHKVYTECHDGVPPEADKVPKPCDYFDLIAGTGTGGLIAIMLGRLRMNTKDCMRVYIQMTRKVFETDKTIAGIPYRSTLFKASMLEEAIKACVRNFEHERNAIPEEDGEGSEMPMTPDSFSRPMSMSSDRNGMPRSSTSSSIRRYSGLKSDAFMTAGDPNAALEDPRKDRRTKTAVTAVLKGRTETDGTSVFLRSYPSRTQPAIESDCAIWQAGRATCATKLAFKEIRIGTSTFQDEGCGLKNSDGTPTYNPAPLILDEAIINEWPGQSVGLLLSIGTGKRPGTSQNTQAEWWEGFAGGLGSFAEAKRKLIAKIEGCEKTHREMLSMHLPNRKVNSDHYLRLNVEVGVGEFGMNEWNRLAEISNHTQAYLNTPSVKSMLTNGAIQMAKVDALRDRGQRQAQASPKSMPTRPLPPARYSDGESQYSDRPAPLRPHHHVQQHLQQQVQSPQQYQRPSDPFAAELPLSSDLNSPPSPHAQPLSYRQTSSPTNQRPLTYSSSGPENAGLGPTDDFQEKFIVPPSSDEFPQPVRTNTMDQKIPLDSEPTAHPDFAQQQRDGPPLPPKTPISAGHQQPNFPPQVPDASDPYRRQIASEHRTTSKPHGPAPPYPDTDGPPPPVNMARKPELVYR